MKKTIAIFICLLVAPFSFVPAAFAEHANETERLEGLVRQVLEEKEIREDEAEK